VRSFKSSIAIALAAAGMCGVASAQWVECPPGTGNCNINQNITSSVTLYASNVYNLVGQIYVTNGATLTIEPGTLIATVANSGGSIAVTRGSKIIAVGTAQDPIIFTSTADVATWVGGDPKTGSWRVASNEWGNLTLMGNAYISEDVIGTNTPTPSATNVADMEGLTTGPAFDRYGGGNDDDDSGTLKYVSIRYTGKVVGLGNELNGLSLGGIGRETDIDYLDIQNNVDDGVEIWGGTVNLKHVNIWDIGDDSFDVDQGWRGKAQFINIVQGYSVVGSQGSGVGDNIFETDGAEQCWYQPVTTASLYNITAIGQPAPGSGDHAMAFRDNARVQYRNAIFMDLGDRLISFDNVDGDGGLGYGCVSSAATGSVPTLSWAATWTTDWNAVPAYAPSDAAPPIANFYSAQSSGKLNEVKDSVFFNNNSGSAYTEAIARGVLGAGATPANGNLVAVASPITSIVRNPIEIISGLAMQRVLSLDPRPANDALGPVPAAPADGFFSQATYRGAFAPNEVPWICGWTAASAFGRVVIPAPVNYCTAGTTTNGCNATIAGVGTASASAASGFTLSVTNVEGNKQGLIFYSVTGRAAAPWGMGSTSFLCVKSPTQRMGTLNSGGTANTCTGAFNQDWNAYTTANPGALGQPFVGCETVQAQAWFRDPAAPKTTNLSNGLEFYVAP
jgi:hypothetical protein